MLEYELVELVNKILQTKCKSNYLEIKAAAEGCPKLFDTLSSFSNQYGGGTIVFGIDENNGFDICGVYDPADLQKKIMEQALQMEPELRPLCTVTNIGGKTIVSAEIQEIDNELKPCFYKGVGRLKGSYVRVGDGDRHMTEYELYSYEAFRKKIQDELRIAERAELSDIDTDAHTQYLITMRKKKPNLADLPTEKIDSLQGFTTDGKPTLTGVMMFSPYPQGFFPQVCVQGTEMGSDNEEDLLIFCRTPRTRTEIEQHFKGRLSINYLMTHIIRPLIQQGKIRLAIPDKPRSKNQKYYS